MPIIYLSPSTQEKNMYVTGSGSEEYWMNRLADAMIPYLNSCGIRYTHTWQHPGDDRRQFHPPGQFRLVRLLPGSPLQCRRA